MMNQLLLYFLIRIRIYITIALLFRAFSAFTLLLGRQE